MWALIKFLEWQVQSFFSPENPVLLSSSSDVCRLIAYQIIPLEEKYREKPSLPCASG
jgi:hypothetical protein